MITKTEITNLPEFNVAGLTVRTINQNGQSKIDMMSLWTKFMSENMVHQIDNRASDDIYCVYTDYETDHTGYYTALLGCRVNSKPAKQEGLTMITILPAKYEVYSLAGEFPKNVRDAWEEIWNGDAARKFTADFDLYTANARSFEETEVKIYLAIE